MNGSNTNGSDYLRYPQVVPLIRQANLPNRNVDSRTIHQPLTNSALTITHASPYAAIEAKMKTSQDIRQNMTNNHIGPVQIPSDNFFLSNPILLQQTKMEMQCRDFQRQLSVQHPKPRPCTSDSPSIRTELPIGMLGAGKQLTDLSCSSKKRSLVLQNFEKTGEHNVEYFR